MVSGMKTKLFNMRCKNEDYARWAAFASSRGMSLAAVIRKELNRLCEKADEVDEMADQIQENFEAFHAEHPEVYTLFKVFTQQLLDRGYKNGSANLIFERIRWETGLDLPQNPVKLNNNYRSRYARMYEADFPKRAGFFRTRALHEETVDSTKAAEDA